MAYIVKLPIVFTYKIETTATPPANLDIVFVDPNGVTTFDESGAAHSAQYVAPSATVEGSYTFSNTFVEPGRWTVAITDGVTTKYRIYNQYKINLEVPVQNSDAVITIPPPL